MLGLVVALPALPLALRRPRRSSDVRAVAVDGACLRGKCDADPAFGYELMRRFSQVMLDRLQATRLRLLDVYGRSAVAEPAMPPLPYRVARRTRDTADTWTLELDPRGAADRARAGPVHDALRLGRRRGADLAQRPCRACSTARPHDPRRRRGHPCALRAAAGRCAGRARPVRHGWPLVDGAQARRGRRRRRARPRAAPAGDPRARAPPRALRPHLGPLRRAHAGRPPLSRRSSSSGARPASTSTSPWTLQRPAGTGTVGRRPEAPRTRRFDPAPRSRSSAGRR